MVYIIFMRSDLFNIYPESTHLVFKTANILPISGPGDIPLDFKSSPFIGNNGGSQLIILEDNVFFLDIQIILKLMIYQSSALYASVLHQNN